MTIAKCFFFNLNRNSSCFPYSPPGTFHFRLQLIKYTLFAKFDNKFGSAFTSTSFHLNVVVCSFFLSLPLVVVLQTSSYSSINFLCVSICSFCRTCTKTAWCIYVYDSSEPTYFTVFEIANKSDFMQSKMWTLKKSTLSLYSDL